MGIKDEYLNTLPENLRLIIQLTDYRTAMLLLQHWGGTDFHFPNVKVITEAHPMAEVLGFNNLEKLCRFWGGENIYIPKGDSYLRLLRNKRIEQDLADLGKKKNTDQTLAKKYGVTTRWIREIKRRIDKPVVFKKNDRQLDMFM